MRTTHPCFLPTRCSGPLRVLRSLRDRDEGVRPCISNFPTPGIAIKKLLRITELLSCRCYTGLGFFVFAEELPGRAFARMRLPVLLRNLSGARPVNELLDHPSEHISHSGAILCSQSVLLLLGWLCPLS